MNRLTFTPWQRRRLQRQLKETSDVHAYRRTLAILEFSHGRPVSAIARMLGVSRQSVHNWLADYARGRDPVALYDRPRSGRPSLWTEEARTLLVALLGYSPQQLGYFAVNWTVPLLQDQLQRRLGLSVADDTIRRELRRQDYVWKRPRYALDPDPERDKKNGGSAGKSRPCRCARPCWLRMRPTYCCSRPCARGGRAGGNLPECA
jgi:transposase